MVKNQMRSAVKDAAKEVTLTIDQIEVTVSADTTILQAAREVGIAVPSLCFLKGINEIAACRVCLVEVEGIEKLVAACNNKVQEGMVVFTNSPRVREARKTNVELILSQHNCDCPYCVRSGNCELQNLANDLGLSHLNYHKELQDNRWNMKYPLFRDASKCIKCMRCIQICDKVQALGVWDLSNTGSRTTVDVSRGRMIKNADCALCGQCITHCPVGALQERNDTIRAFEALSDPVKVTVVQIAPAVRAAWGESLGLSREKATVKRLVAALRRMGFHYIFDTDLSADLTIMEEGSEMLDRLLGPEGRKFPMFTSCCPGWVRFLKSQYPDMVDQLSTAKSPQQMFGAVIKSYFAETMQIDPAKIYSISIMPCLAKKHECDIPVMNSAGAGQDVDLVLTTREIERMIRAEHIDVNSLEEEAFDPPMGISTGAGVIFGSTGGVMEAALRSASFLRSGKNPEPDAFREVRGMDGWKEAVFDLGGIQLHIAVVSGLGNARKLIEAIRAGKVQYDFVEVMACPGGCVGGGGQPIHEGEELASLRSDTLYGLDRCNEFRFSHENPAVLKMYETYLKAPLSSRAHELLHTDHKAWEMPGEGTELS